MDDPIALQQNPEQTYHSIRHSIVAAQHKLSAAVNSAMVTAYWEIGQQIYLACGESDRAGYGKKLLDYLSAQLTAEFGKGFDVSNLRNMRRFYMTFPIRETLSPELSWSHYVKLMRVPDEAARTFYTEECTRSAWSVRQLERQIHTMYYQRILASQDKDAVSAEIQTTEPKPEYEKIVKDPYVMEFLQIKPDTHVYEGDLGQMQTYVNYYTRELMNEGDTPPIGIVLCADKSDAVVKYTLPEDNNQIFASKYFTYLPTEEELKRELRLDEFQSLNE